MDTLEKEIVDNQPSQHEGNLFDEEKHTNGVKEIEENKKIIKEEQANESEELKNNLHKGDHLSNRGGSEWGGSEWGGKGRGGKGWGGKGRGGKGWGGKGTKEILPIVKKSSFWNKLKTFRNNGWKISSKSDKKEKIEK